MWKVGKDPKRKNFRPIDKSRPLKVGIVSEYYYPHLGGLSGDVHFAAVEFTKLGYDVKLITSNVAEPHNIHHSPLGFEIIRVGKSIPIIANGSLAKVSFAWNLGSQVKKMIAEQKFDVIHIHCPLTPILPLIVQRYADCPTVGHVHTLLKSKPIYYRLFEKHLSRFMNDFEGNIAVSKTCAKPFSEWFKCEFEVIPNGVPMDEFNQNIPRIPKFDDGKTNLFFIGRMEPRNGISVLIDAFRIVHREAPNTRLILAGAGPLKAFYEESMEEELKTHIHFIGPILEEKPQYFATADINVCPTTRVAALGVTLLESMASNKPTVASDIPAYHETAEAGKEVLMAHPDKPEEFAAQILRLIKEPGLGAVIAKRALIKMEKFYSWTHIIARVDEYTNRVLGRLEEEKKIKVL
ncbi:MAG: glycosyltransferase family 4 protein [Deltaproteobacteria bacterium]|nr:glycosyltransferase family 4 protein [Deltaproteobacteria bacterium]